MTDLIERIKTAIAEDERAARYAMSIGGNGIWTEVTSGTLAADGVEGMDGLVPIGDLRLSRHIERHHPARALRQAGAHRKILELHPHDRFQEPLSADSPFEEDRRPAFAEDPRYVGCRLCDWDYRFEVVEPSWWCATVLAIAAIYRIEP